MCTTPITIGKGIDKMLVGCGKCMPCHIKYCNQWAFRFNIHYNENPLAYCLTLTYDSKHLPLVQKDGKTYMTLVKSHTQDFFKKLRNLHYKRHPINRPKISYIIAGEYGDKFKRPHYHAIVFNAHADDILQSWDKGAIYFGSTNVEATLVYTLKYTLKGRIYNYYHKQKPYIRPFMNVSKGIGSSLLNTMNPNNIPTTVIHGKIKMPLPRYYTKKLNITIDTSLYQESAIIKAQQHNSTLEAQGLTLTQWRKMYHNYLWKANKTHFYDNQILLDIPTELLKQLEAMHLPASGCD